MDFNKRSLRELLGFLIPLIIAGILNLGGSYELKLFIPAPAGITVSLILSAIFLAWGLSVRRRFPQKQMRSFISFFSAAILLLCLLSRIKYSFVRPGGTLARYLWYAYYIPLVFGPLFMVYASLYFGRSDDYRISKKWRWAYLPAALISLGILTNDFHQLAFRFPNGFAESERNYTHGVLYYAAAVWIVLALFCVIALAVRYTFHRRLFKTAWLPLAVLAVVATYLVLYVSSGNEKSILQRFFQMSDFFCISSIALWESFVIARIVVSNSDYPAIFSASSLNAGLAGVDFKVRHVSENGVRPQPDDLKAARDNETLMPDGDTLLKARPVQGGWFYWTEDISDLRRLNEALNDTADYLEEENALLRVSAQIEEGRRQTAVQTRLYDRVTQSLAPQLEALNLLLSDLPEDEEAFRKTIMKAGLLISYLKRRSNLLLHADSHPVFSGEELALCFEESAKALRMANVPCEVFVGMDVRILAGDAVRLYETFEAAAELTFGSLRSLRVTLKARQKNLTAMELILESSGPLSQNELDGLRQLFEEISFSDEGGSSKLCFTIGSA